MSFVRSEGLEDELGLSKRRGSVGKAWSGRLHTQDRTDTGWV